MFHLAGPVYPAGCITHRAIEGPSGNGSLCCDSQPLWQHLYATKGFLSSQHPLLIKAEHLVRYENSALTVEPLSAALDMTSRTLHRKMRDRVQESPKSFIIRVRIETAVAFPDTPGKTIGQIATACSYRADLCIHRV